LSQVHGFPLLLSPLRIGTVTLRNRIVSSAHDTVMAHDGLVTDRLVAYHRARAEGGVGLVVTQAAGIHETARYTSHVLMASDDSCVEGFGRIADAVHPHGTTLFAQLFHPGREIMEGQDGSLPVAYAPSAVPTDRFHVVPRAMPLDLIAEVVAGYAAAARRLRTAGVDGVEVVASHGYLPAQFLNPRTNLREDGYGGDDAGRQRFLLEVMAAVRAAVGPGYPVGLRISVDERAPAGLTTDEAVAAVAALQAGPGTAPDYVSVVAGTSATNAGSDHIVPPMTMANGYTAPLAARVKAVTDRPVIVAGRINQPQEAERILAAGQADACAMTRALICDPLLPAKTAAGDLDGIRACVGCNQACIGHFHAGYPISCIQRPETGRELTYAIRRPAARSRQVLVAGGGPAGLKAAAVAAERGHRVTLFEAGRQLGGQVRLAERLPGRAEFGGVTLNLAEEARRAGAKLVTGVRVDAGLVAAEGADAVLVATGARPSRPAVEVMDSPVLLDAWTLLDGGTAAVGGLPPGHVLVADWRCDWVGLGLAILLAGSGHRVTLAVDGYTAGQLVQQYVRDEMLAQAHRLGVTIVPTTRLYGVDGDTGYLQHTLSEQPVLVEGVAATVLAGANAPDDALLLELTGAAPVTDDGDLVTVLGVGDCLAPRTVEEAVLEGLKAGWDL
jgi:2,4-dienoyl-CoA reductase-like NADH-dependent reductase (Old Yellow Enzyme family)